MRRNNLYLGVALILSLAVIRLFDPLPVRETRGTYFDYLQRVSPREYVPLPVRIIDIDESSLANLGQWPWPRDILADLVNRLNALGAASIGFDVLFAEPDRLSPLRLSERLDATKLLTSGLSVDEIANLDTDAKFAKAIGNAPVILSTALVARNDPQIVQPKSGLIQVGNAPTLGLPYLYSATPVLPILAEAASGIGNISVSPTGDGSGRVRTMPTFWQIEGSAFPSLSLEVLRVGIQASTFTLWGNEDQAGILKGISIGQFSIPTEPDGQMWVRFRHEEPSVYLSAADLLVSGSDERYLRSQIEGHLILVGTSAAGLLDIRTTALGDSVPGVSIHAQVIEQILLGEFLARNDTIEAVEFFGFLLLSVLLLLAMALRGPFVSLVVFILTSTTALAGSWVAFDSYQLLVDATFPVLGGILVFMLLSAYKLIVTDREKRVIRRSFAHYVSSDILRQIEEKGVELELGGKNRPLTVMFSDIRSFTPLSETLGAQDLVTLLNKYFESQDLAIMAEEGTIDKFIGDAIMAFWNAPLETPEHCRKACLAALGMRNALQEFNEKSEYNPINVGIGIATGIACVGNIGSKNRFNYSAIGPTVNVASRLEGRSRHVSYDIVVTSDVRDAASDLAFLDAGAIDLKGVSHRTPAFVLVGDKAFSHSSIFKNLLEKHDHLLEQIRSNSAAQIIALKECIELAEAISDRLVGFYEEIPKRDFDFKQ